MIYIIIIFYDISLVKNFDTEKLFTVFVGR